VDERREEPLDYGMLELLMTNTEYREVKRVIRVAEPRDRVGEAREIKRHGRHKRATRSVPVILVASALALLVLFETGSPPFRSRDATASHKIASLPYVAAALHVRGMLWGVDCPTTSDCWAVGQRGTVPSNLIEHWTGDRWQVVASPNPNGRGPGEEPGDNLRDVSCSSPVSCVTVGSRGVGELAGGLTETWTGHGWALRPGGVDGLALSCPRADECVAVTLGSGGPFALAEIWNGSTWRHLSVPQPEAAVLDGVSCGSPASCWFVGSFVNGIGKPTDVAAADHWLDGRWTETRIRGVSGGFGAVSFVGTKFCIAIGRSASSVWNGAVWRQIPGPRTPVTLVACGSASSCLAVGNGSAASYNGTTWLHRPMPQIRGIGGFVPASVTKVSGSDYIVVGGTDPLTSDRVVIEEYNGHAFTVLQD
jgi:hypothetical protein